MKTARMLVLSACALVMLPAQADPQSPLVAHDPFARPELNAAVAAPRAAGSSAATQLPAGALRLKGVLSAGALRLANIDGTILAAGEEIYGYRVERIALQAVTLRRGSDSLTINLEGAGANDGEAD